MSHSEAIESFHRATLSFVKTELEVAETFADIALESDDGASLPRNRQNARKAYDTALRFPQRTPLTAVQDSEIGARLASLKSEPTELGEEF